MKKRQLIAALALALAVPAAAQAALFDADGSAGVASATNIGALDWGPTGIFADNANLAIAAFQTGACAQTPTACQFNLYTHASLIGVLDANGNALPTPSGLNTSYEITMIARFTEVVTGAGVIGGNPIVTFATVPSDPGFLQIFYDDSRDAAALTGSGYNDGRLILNGDQVAAATSSFIIDASKPVVPLDSTSGNGDQYPGQLTVQGSGSSGNLAVDNLTYDSSFFVSPLETFGIQFANISLGLPYLSVDPSDCYTGAAQPAIIGATFLATGCSILHVNGPMAANSAEIFPGLVPNIGLINATAPTTTGGPDFVAQSDFNSPLASVPEPGSLALFGLGIGLMGMFGRLRRRLA